MTRPRPYLVGSTDHLEDRARARPSIAEALSILANACSRTPNWWQVAGLAVVVFSGTATVLGWIFFVAGLMGRMPETGGP